MFLKLKLAIRPFSFSWVDHSRGKHETTFTSDHLGVNKKAAKIRSEGMLTESGRP